MAIGWLTALKMVPWSDVIENAPTLVNGARKLFTKTRDEPPPGSAASTTSATAAAEVKAPPVDVQHRLAQLSEALTQSQARVVTLETESRDTAALIKSLAEQQEKVIGAIDVLGKRTNVLIGLSVVLAIVCVGLIVALVLR